MTDTNNEEAPVKLMTAYSGMNTTLSIGLKYYIIRSLSLSFKYRLQLAQIRAWDENMISAADYITFTISYHIKTRDSI